VFGHATAIKLPGTFAILADRIGLIITMFTLHMRHSAVTKIKIWSWEPQIEAVHYRQNKNMLISYHKNKLGYF